MNISRSLILALALTLSATMANGQEAETGSWWNPFGGGSTTTENDVAEDSIRKSSYFDESPSEKLFSMPSMPKLPKLSWPGSGSKAKAKKSNSPSMFSKVSRTSKRAWGNTVDYMNPFNDGPTEPAAHGYQPQLADSAAKESSWNWPWTSKPEPQEPDNVNAFLRQPRPRL